MEVISEAHVFAEKTGLGSEILETMIGDMFGPVAHSYSKRLTTGAYAPPPCMFPSPIRVSFANLYEQRKRQALT